MYAKYAHVRLSNLGPGRPDQRRLDTRHNSRDIHAVFCIPVVVN